jgi:DNA-binding PadR family transcriptional regulator
MGDLEAKTNVEQTATAIRKHLRTQHAVGLNSVIRAIKDLVKLGLVKEDGVTDIRCCKLYRLTPAGARVLNQLKR